LTALSLRLEAAFAQAIQRQWLLLLDDQADRPIDLNANQRLANLTQIYLQTLQAQPRSRLILSHRQPIPFLAGLFAAAITDTPVFLGNPQWGELEWQQVGKLVQPNLVWGVPPKSPVNGGLQEISRNEFTVKTPLSPPTPYGQATPKPRGEARNSCSLPLPRGGLGWGGDVLDLPTRGIMIPTGGSSGKIRFAIHDWQTVIAAVEGFQAYMQVEQINSCCVLPLYHVSGLMQVLRSFWTGGRLVIATRVPSGRMLEKYLDLIETPPKSPNTGGLRNEDFFLSLVPTQLQRLLQTPDHGLASWKTILLGGAPASSELLAQARDQKLPIALSYGMTETAAAIAILKPEDFLAGATDCGQVLPHAQISIQGTSQLRSPPFTGDLGGTPLGQLMIQASSLAQGYLGDNSLEIAADNSPQFTQDGFITDDLGYLDANGHLHILGRSSQKIISGGENIFAPEVEAAILSTGLVSEVVVLGVPDPEWGQVVTAIYVPKQHWVTDQALRQQLQGRLSKFKQPKYWLAAEQLPRNAVGKINRAELLAWAISQRVDIG
jgi:O-succinylbenzoic acid--CoA ligase